MASALQLEKALEKFAAGFEVDFKGTEVPAARLADVTPSFPPAGIRAEPLCCA